MKVDLDRHLQIFRALFYSPKFHGKKVRSFRKKVSILCGYIHGSSYEFEPDHVKNALIQKTKEFIIDELFFGYVEKEHYKKYNCENSLSTWIEQYIYLNINNLLRKYRPRSEAEGINTRSDVCDPGNSNFRLSYEEFEGWLDMTSDMENPETLLQHKELLVLSINHFGVEDLKVILGVESKLDTIRKHNLNYDKYTKILYLKKCTFLPVAASSGYECTH